VHLKPDPRFLAITAHDLRGAVGVLDGAMKELTRDISNDRPDAAKLSLMMTRSTQRLLLIADRLSVLAKLTDNEELELSERGDVTPLVKEAANRSFSAHGRRALRLRFEGGPAPAVFHGQALAGAVAELTALVCSFSQAEVSICIAGSATATRITFVSDNSSEGVQRTLRDRTGTTQAGAGVALAAAVVERHHGQLELSKLDGSSASISIVLPVST